MRILFMGTPRAAVPSLERCLLDGHNIVAVWTQPDKPAGRGQKLGHSEVKDFALQHELTVEQPAKIRNEAAKKLFSSYQADLAVVVAYGKILPQEFLTAPKRGCINVHFSLLPRYRGAAPVNWAIINGEEKTGVTTMFIEQRLDSGPILLRRHVFVGDRETAPELMTRLSLEGADLLGETLDRLDEITPLAQHDEDATYAPVLKKEDGRIDWSHSAEAIERRVRGLQPWPNAYTNFRGQHFIIWNAEPQTISEAGQPGQIAKAEGDSLIVNCGGGSALQLLEMQPQGKRRMSARDFLNGTHLKAGEGFGET
jgi:methionyl-tRNA formyltransferase